MKIKYTAKGWKATHTTSDGLTISATHKRRKEAVRVVFLAIIENVLDS